MSSNAFSGHTKYIRDFSTAVEVTPTPFVKLRRSLAVEKGISEKTFRPTSITKRRVKQLIKGDFFASFFVRTKNEEDTSLEQWIPAFAGMTISLYFSDLNRFIH